MDLYKDLFADTKKVLQNGWCKGRFHDKMTDAYCIIGAMRRAYADHRGYHYAQQVTSSWLEPYARIIVNHLYANYPKLEVWPGATAVLRLYDFNDHIARDRQELETLLDKSHATLQEMV